MSLNDLKLKSLGRQLNDMTTQITANTNAINGISASPKPYATLSALQTAFPTGDTHAYVVTADGKWYYWNGSAWTAGGIYQSTGIANGTVIKESLDVGLQNILDEIYATQSVTLTETGYYRDSTYTQTSNTDVSSVIIPVAYGEKYRLTSWSNYQARRYLILDASNKVLAYDSFTDYTLHSNTEIIIPQGAVNMMLQTNKNYKTSFLLEKRTGFNPVKNNGVSYRNFDSILQSALIPKYTNLNPVFQSGVYYRDGSLQSGGVDWQYTSIPVLKGDMFKIFGQDYYSAVLFLLKSTSGATIATYPVAQTNGTQNNNIDFVVPQDGTLYVNKRISDSSIRTFVLKATSYQSADNPLVGKLIYADGDSVAYGAGSGGESYANIIELKNTMFLTKKAVSGTTIAIRNGRTDSILERVKAMVGSYDYILLEGGYNDLFLALPIGVLTNGYSDTLDETTVIGAMESMCKTIVTNYPISKKLFVLGQKTIMKTTWLPFTNADIYWDAIKSALEKWSIPYVDLRKTSSLGAYNSTWLANYFIDTDGGTHPTYNGYLYFYVPQIEAKLKTL